MLGYTKITQMIKQKQYILGFKDNKTFWITFHTAKHYFSTILPVILRLSIKNESHGWRASCVWTANFKRLQEVEFYSIKGALPSLRKFLETETPCWKMLFTLNTLLELMIFKFVLEFSVTSKNGLIRNATLLSKFMASQPG